MPYPGPGPALSLCSALCLPPASARAARAHWTEDRQDGGGTHRQASPPRGKVSQPETRSPGLESRRERGFGGSRGPGRTKGNLVFYPQPKEDLARNVGSNTPALKRNLGMDREAVPEAAATRLRALPTRAAPVRARRATRWVPTTRTVQVGGSHVSRLGETARRRA